MQSITTLRFITAILIGSLMAAHGMKRNLTIAGAIAAFTVGTLIMAITPPFGILLIAFYLASSKFTHWKSDIKLKQEDQSTKRGAIQVLTNSLWILLAAVLQYLEIVEDQKLFSLFCVAVLACNCGDTWASEIGAVLSNSPVHILTFKSVPPGTNGGISLPGTLASITGGLFIGIGYHILSVYFYADTLFLFPSKFIVCLAGLAGFFGSIIDSLLGATLQATYYDSEKKKIVKKHTKSSKLISGVAFLSNEMVNFASALITGLIFVLVIKFN